MDDSGSSNQPGQIVAPQGGPGTAGSAPIAPNPTTPAVAAAQPQASPSQPAQTATPQVREENSPVADDVAPDDASPDTEDSQPYALNDEENPPRNTAPARGPVSWTASEFIAHDKSFGWYAVLVIVTLVVAALVFLLTRDKISTGVVIIAAIALGVYGARKPHQLQYALNDGGVHIGQRYYPFDMFRSFALIEEGAFSSIAFRPHKRFGQLVTIYFDPKDEDAIVDLLSSRLPLEKRGQDVVDSFMRKIRF
ncbi:MAG TPA: hypothetical protein VF261_01775 [Candidatus Saccharimonadales bacterium]